MLEGFFGGGSISRAGLSDSGGGVAAWGEINLNGMAILPVAGDLEDGGAAESAVGEEHFFAEGLAAGLGDHFGGDAGEVAVALAVRGSEDKRDEAGAGGDDFQAELAGEVVAEGGCAHFGDGETTRGYYQGWSAIIGGVAADDKLRIAGDFGDLAVQDNFHAGGTAFGFEHVGDVAGGVVAEELAKRFFVVRDAMFFDEGEEVRRGVAGQSGFGKMGIGGEEILRLAMNVREVAAASARDEDFLADAVGVFEDGDAAAVLARLNSAHQAGGAASDD